ncbi:MAG TPA: VWA domain-containing protein, partial [Deinococcales bacterium]|nr:VWA domain-containing protein [Deinococcales bacterium]
DVPVTWFAFAADALRLPDPAAPVPRALDTGLTDLARALQVAAGSGARRILLVSDGHESRGSVLQALPGVPVDTLAVEPVENLSAESLLLPERAAPGETVEALAVLNSDRATRVRLNISADGQSLPPVEQDIPEGRSTVPFSFTAPEAGTLSLDVLAEPGWKQPLADDRLRSELQVSDQPPVLVIGDPALAGLLESAGAEVVRGTPEDLTAPVPYGAVAVRGAAKDFTAGQHELLKEYVEAGGGLLMTGGPDSFGFGGWFRTPVEDTLPVTTDLRTEVEVPLVALVLIIDRSQSMSAGNPSRLELAKEGAIAVVELAFEQDLLGLIAFSDRSEWIFPLRPATERGKREMLADILGLTTSGGTILGPAYTEAIEVLEAEEAAIKHIIILSDGKLYDGQGPFSTRAVDFGSVAGDAASAGITTSTIALGSDADFAQLSLIAEAGGGRYYEALDTHTLPRIFTSEALVATRSLLRETPLEPVAHEHVLSVLSGTAPEVEAYVATAGRPAAELILEGEDGEPVLSVIRSGLGRTAVLTTDLNGWAPALLEDDAFASSLLRVLRWLQVQPDRYRSAVEVGDGVLNVSVDAVEAGEYLEDRSLRARYGGTTVRLEQSAPGRYTGQLPLEAASGTLLITDGDDVVARQAVNAAAAEFSRSGGPELLGQLSRQTGGTALTDPEEQLPAAAGRTVRLEGPALLAAFVLFMAELALRRFGRRRRRAVPSGREAAAFRRQA